MKVLLFGAGAVGVFFASRLAAAGAEISVIVRGDRDAVREQGGYRVVSDAFGEYRFAPARVIGSAAEYGESADLLLVANKVLPGVNAPEAVAPALGPGTALLLIQNGLDVEPAFHDAFSENELLSAVAYIGASRPEHGVVRQQGSKKLVFGDWPSGASARARELCGCFRRGGVDCDVTEDIESLRFRKLLWNAPFNTVSVLAGGLRTDEMMDRGPVERLCTEIMREVLRVAAACGKTLPESLIEDNLTFTRNYPPYKTSMLQDYEHGRELEVDAILGSLLRRAEAHRVDVPRLRCCHALLQSRNRKVQESKR